MTQVPFAPDSGAGRPTEVGLVGLGYYTQAVVDLCRAAGLRIAFVVDDVPEFQPNYNPDAVNIDSLRDSLAFSGIPLWPHGELVKRLQANAPMPFLIASRIENYADDAVDSDPYLARARRVRDCSRGARLLHHPVVLAHLLPVPPYRKRVSMFGFPGSGNILAQHLVGAILERCSEPPPPATAAIAAFAEHYYLSTLTLLRSLLAPLAPRALDVSPVQFPTMTLTLALPDDRYALVRDIPSNRHLATYYYPTHAVPTRLAIEEFLKLGATCIGIVRHPCETILSYASKISRPPTPAIDNEDFFGETGLRLAEWLRQLRDLEDRVLVLRYEDLVARRTRPLLDVAERLGVDLGEREASELFDRYLHRDLLPDQHPGHFYRGGSDKWKRHFLPHHVEQLLGEGMGPLADHWGYDLTPSPEAPTTGRDRGASAGQRWGTIPLNALTELKSRSYRAAPFPLVIDSSSSEASRFIAEAIHGAEFVQHLDLGGLGPHSAPWIPAIPWETLSPILYPEVIRKPVVC
jgi:hypothetical protein